MGIINRIFRAQKVVLLVIGLLFVFVSVHAQEKAYWQGLSQKNPALIATPSDWIFGGYGFTNQDMK